jgi:peptidoglycan-N-acetylglucosamine deacetylase
MPSGGEKPDKSLEDTRPDLSTRIISQLHAMSRAPYVRMLLLTGTVIIVVLSSIGIAGLVRSDRPARTNSAKAAAKAPTAMPTATPVDPMTLWNDSMGCANGSPHPFPDVIATGRYEKALLAPREVALAFDDGPTPYSSPDVISVLEQTHTPATFFVMGQYVANWPDLLRREWNGGFAIGVHTWDHPDMTQLSPDQVRWQFSSTLDAIHNVLGPDACIWLWRPPYGSYNASVMQIAQSYGLTTVTWDDTSFDWNRPGIQQIADNVLNAAHPGAIVLVHDGPSLRDQTAAAIPIILDGLKARGLTPVTLPQLLYDAHFPSVGKPGPISGKQN